MAPRKKQLELNITYRDKVSSYVSVKRQSHRNRKFGIAGHSSFKASNGYILRSEGCIEWNAGCKTFFVRGEDMDYDKDTVVIHSKYIKELIAAVKEYNECVESFDLALDSYHARLGLKSAQKWDEDDEYDEFEDEDIHDYGWDNA